MKKIVFLCMIILVFVLMGHSQAKESGIRLKDYPASAKLWESVHRKVGTELQEIVILPRTPFNEEEAGRIINRLNQLPPSLLKKIHQEGIIVKLFTGKLTENPSASHLKGVMPRGYTNTLWDEVPGIGGSKTVLIKIGASEKGNGHGSVNLELHELAHSIDRHIWHDLRFQPDFIAIWQKEKELLFASKPYFLTYPEEYLAECFAYFYLGAEYREELREKAPLTFELLQNLSQMD